jgi:hypothetical protein
MWGAPGTFTSVAAQAPEPRKVALIVDLRRPAGSMPLFGPDAKPSADAPATIDAIRRDVARLAGATDVPFALELSPVLCEELRLLDTAPARALLAEIDRLSDGHPALTVPYTDVRFVDVEAGGLVDEIADGAQTVAECTKDDLLGLVAASDLGVPDDDRIRALAGDRFRYVLSGYAFPPPTGSRPWPYAVPAIAASAGFDAQDVLVQRPGADRLAVVVDTHDAPPLVGSLAAEPRIELQPVSAFLSPDIDFREGRLYEPERVSGRYVRALRQAHDALDDFRSYTLDGNRLAEIFRTVIAEAGATADPKVRTSTHVRGTLGLVESALRRQFDLVSLTEGSVTFTSRRGSVPVTVSNEASYPVKVRVSLRSSKLSFPEGPSIVRVIEPPGGTITFDAIAKSSGTFPLTAVLKGRRGEITLDTAEFTVRSTAANLPVLILTIAGALLLLVMYVGRVGRRRRESS